MADNSQDRAITFGNGPVMVLAGPGSGKTYVITNRIRYLIDQLNYSPGSILVITFTKAAALEMRERYRRISNGHGLDVTFGTFHSVYYNFLRIFNPQNTPRIIDNIERNKILERICKDTFGKNSFEPADLANAISKYKSNKERPETVIGQTDDYRKDFFAKYKEYNEILDELGLMDYDDILLRCLKFLKENEKARDIIRDTYSNILVDEFQDINEVQYDILKMIIKDNTNVFAVGDDDQSIYGFRGSKPEIMSQFVKDYPKCTLINLDKNYRSYNEITVAAQIVIGHNKKRLKTNSQESVRGVDSDSFVCRVLEGKKECMDTIRSEIDRALSNGQNLAILVRTNKDMEKYYNLCGDRSELEVKIKEAIDVYDDICAYYNFSKTHRRDDLIRILNKPQRYLTRSLFTQESVDLGRICKQQIGNHKADELSRLNTFINQLARCTPFAFMHYLSQIIGYGQYVCDKYGRESEAKRFLDNAMNLSGQYMRMDEFMQAFNPNLVANRQGNQSGFDKSGKDAGNPIKVMTFHASKGLEFDVVIIPDVNEGKIPGRISVREDDIAEERRLFYVAMTRARERLVILSSKQEDSNRILPSRFIADFI